jgi:hypoxanthine phosphoribosyltransferase
MTVIVDKSQSCQSPAAPLRLDVMTESNVRTTMASLAEMVERDGLTPGLVVGILEGGRDPATYFAQCWDPLPPTLFLKLQRASTSPVKKVLVGLVLRAPAVVINTVRLLEMQFREIMHRRSTPPAEVDPVPELASPIRDALRQCVISADRPVILVDDAIDTGRTVARIAATFRAAGVGADSLKVACITQTLSAPQSEPDYAAFRRVVFRFPWSMDAEAQSPQSTGVCSK